MLRTYRAVFRAPGAAAFCAAGFVMRMPIAIFPIGIVLIISARTGHYGFAGVLSATYVLGAVPGNPLLARLIDRYGQRRMLLPASAVTLAAVVVLAVLLEDDAPDAALAVPTFIAGFSYLSVGSLVRARWSLVLAGRPELGTAYSLESVLDEVIFVFGPLIATLIATHADPIIVLYVCCVLIGVGALWLSTQRGTEPMPHPAGGPPHPSALRHRGVVLLSVGAAGMGALFASAEVTMVAFCGQHGQRGLSGLVLALFAAGSGTAGLVYGARTWRASVLARYRLQAVIFAVLPILFLAATDVVVLAVCAFVVGLATAPTLITAFGLVEQLVPGTSLTEGLAWVLTGLNIGYGAGAALVGGIADAHGARVAFLVAIASGLFTGAAALALYRRLTAAADASQPVAVR
ncbi:MAG: MFS transporter [Actinomycetota bacterium]|nr:MFS transporter [Actinomycetota bacterium]